MASSARIIVTGLIAQHPQLGGVAWDYAQYVVGLARLGHDVYYFEDSGQWPYNVDGGASKDDWIARDCSANVRRLASTMASFGLAERWAYHAPTDRRWYGLEPRTRRDVLKSADLLINLSGTLRRPNEYRTVGRLAYIDTDPGFTQARLARGEKRFGRRVDAHDVHFTFGEALAASSLSDTTYRWRPTRQPVVLDLWRTSGSSRDVFTTVMSWTSYRPLRFEGVTYGQKDVELGRFLGLPGRVSPTRLEIALNATPHAEWEAARRRSGVDHLTPAERLARAGWQVIPASSVSQSLGAYRSYIQASKAEWSVAKGGYVSAGTGWFSCRSACYLAAGRPVVVQDTGFSQVLPTGEGILAFSDLDGAAHSIESVNGDYARHAKAAQAIAAEYFDSDRVLGALVEDALA